MITLDEISPGKRSLKDDSELEVNSHPPSQPPSPEVPVHAPAPPSKISLEGRAEESLKKGFKICLVGRKGCSGPSSVSGMGEQKPKIPTIKIPKNRLAGGLQGAFDQEEILHPTRCV